MEAFLASGCQHNGQQRRCKKGEHEAAQRTESRIGFPRGTDSYLRSSYASPSNVSSPRWCRMRSPQPLPRTQTQGLALDLVQRQF